MNRTKPLESLLASVLLAMLLPQTIAAYDFMVDGLCYNYNSDSVSVTITYQQSSLLSPYYTDLSGDLVIPGVVSYNGRNYSVTSIGHNAFCYYILICILMMIFLGRMLKV